MRKYDCAEGIVSFVTDPTNFIVQLVKNLEEIEKLSEEIQAYCDESNLSSSNASYGLEDYVIAKFAEDKVWYRAKITGMFKPLYFAQCSEPGKTFPTAQFMIKCNFNKHKYFFYSRMIKCY